MHKVSLPLNNIPLNNRDGELFSIYQSTDAYVLHAMDGMIVVYMVELLL